MKTTQYRRKPTYCTATRFVKENVEDEHDPIIRKEGFQFSYFTDKSGRLNGLFMNALGLSGIQEGDYIVKGEDGIPRVVSAEDFEREYEAVE